MLCKPPCLHLLRLQHFPLLLVTGHYGLYRGTVLGQLYLWAGREGRLGMALSDLNLLSGGCILRWALREGHLVTPQPLLCRCHAWPLHAISPSHTARLPLPILPIPPSHLSFFPPCTAFPLPVVDCM